MFSNDNENLLREVVGDDKNDDKSCLLYTSDAADDM